jgi:adenylate kinase
VRVAVTGTPGTGKTTAVERLDTDLDVVHLNDLIEPEALYEARDEDRESLVVDLDAIRDRFAQRDDLLVESHLAHHLDVDRCVLLRCQPAEIEQRLRDRGESEASAIENAESEALDVVLGETVDRHGTDQVYEIETTDSEPSAVADAIEAVIAGDREPAVGTVSYIDYL